MHQLAAAQQTSAAKLLAFFQRYQTKECALQINQAKITSENVFNGDHFTSILSKDYKPKNAL